MKNKSWITRNITESKALKKVLIDERFKTWRKVIVFVIGMTILLIGIAMIVLPGPALIIIPAGLAILGTEFIWAKKWLKKIKEKADSVGHKLHLTNKNNTKNRD